MENKEDLIILGRCGMKYIDKSGFEYYIDSEMIIDQKYDFSIYPDDIEFCDNYLKEKQTDNINYTEVYDRNQKSFIGTLAYKNKFPSNISKETKENIIERVLQLGKTRGIKIKLEKSLK